MPIGPVRTYGAKKTAQAKGFLRNPDSKLRIPSDDDLVQLNGIDDTDMCVERVQSDIDIIKKTPYPFGDVENVSASMISLRICGATANGARSPYWTQSTKSFYKRWNQDCNRCNAPMVITDNTWPL